MQTASSDFSSVGLKGAAGVTRRKGSFSISRLFERRESKVIERISSNYPITSSSLTSPRSKCSLVPDGCRRRRRRRRRRSTRFNVERKKEREISLTIAVEEDQKVYVTSRRDDTRTTSRNEEYILRESLSSSC